MCDSIYPGRWYRRRRRQHRCVSFPVNRGEDLRERFPKDVATGIRLISATRVYFIGVCQSRCLRDSVGNCEYHALAFLRKEGERDGAEQREERREKEREKDKCVSQGRCSRRISPGCAQVVSFSSRPVTKREVHLASFSPQRNCTQSLAIMSPRGGG